MSFNLSMDKETTVHIYSGILCQQLKETVDKFNNLEVSQTHCVEWMFTNCVILVIGHSWKDKL